MGFPGVVVNQVSIGLLSELWICWRCHCQGTSLGLFSTEFCQGRQSLLLKLCYFLSTGFRRSIHSSQG